jgi:hypothetical protein
MNTRPLNTAGLANLLCFGIAAVTTALDAPQVTITEAHGHRIIRSNGLPNHATGQFPNRGNPNTISEQKYEFRVTLAPKPKAKPVPANRAFFGVAVNGVPFEAGTAEFWNRDPSLGWNYEAKSGHTDLGLDQNDAHVQPGGVYHYHGLPSGLVESLGGKDGSKMILIGWAADGFPIYTNHGHQDPKVATSPLVKMRSSYQLKKGRRPSGNRGPGGDYDGTFTADYEYVAGSGDLDDCNGRFGVTPDYPKGIYHYYITDAFPYLSRQWRGGPDASFLKKGGPPGMGGPPGRGRRGGPGFGLPPGFGPPPPFGPGF